MPVLDAPIMAAIGLLTMLAGAALITWGARRLGGDPDDRNDSLLAPTLAVDTLDPDLRVLYMRTLVLDAKCAAAYGDAGHDTWSRLGRELRRSLVAEQSYRVRELDVSSLGRIENVLERALARVDSEEPIDDGWSDLLRDAEHARDGRSESD